MASQSDFTTLLQHTRWIHALARSLQADRHLAEDLAQDAWVVALERPPELGKPVRGWLATVLRHRFFDGERRRRRREQRERAVARHDELPSSADVVEKACAQRRIVEAVLELDEPYRTTVLLRFFEDLSQREIARRMQTTAPTVNSRLQRALQNLRERLARGGGAGSWLAALAPLREPPPAVALPVFGVVTMKVALAVAAAAAVVAAAGLLWLGTGPSSRPAASSGAVLSPADVAPGERITEPAGTRPTAAVRDLVVPRAAAPVPAAPDQMAPSVRGRVVDAHGQALASVRLAAAPGDSATTCTSDANGRFELPLGGDAETIVAADPRYATVLAGSARVHGDTQPTVVVAPRIELAGVVLDELRAQLPGATVDLLPPSDFGASFGFALDYSVPVRCRGETGADGRFVLAAAPAIDGAVLRASLAGYETAALTAPVHTTGVIEFVLPRPRAPAGLVRGLVLDASGARVAEARVSAGADIARTTADGSFALDLRSVAGTRLVAVKAGYLPAVLDAERDANGRVIWPRSDVVLQLGGAALALQGRVVDAEGKPVAAARVWVDDPTPFGVGETRFTTEALLRADERFWSFELTRDDGSFTLAGLLPRAYRVQSVDLRSLASTEATALPGAASLELRLPTRDVYERVAGRVVSAAGQPLRGVNVRLYRVTFELPHEQGVDNDGVESAAVVTGADGAFVFRDVPRHGVDLMATGDTIQGAAAMLADVPDPTRIEIVASLRLHLQVELQAPTDRADLLRVIDAGGKRVLLKVFHGGGSHASFELPIHDGRSAVMAVDESAATLVLLRGGAEVARIPLQLVHGITNTVRH